MSDVRVDEAARLATEWATLGSVEFVVNQEHTLLPSWAKNEGDAFRWVDTHYIETPARQRFSDESMKNKDGKVVRHTTSRTDGQRYSIVEYQKDEPDIPKSLFIGTSFDNEATSGGSSRPEPLRYYFIDKTPLHEALPSSTYLGTDKFQGKPSHVFLFKDMLWGQLRQSLVLHLAKDGIFPHLMIFYKSEEDRLNDRPLWTWSASTIESVRGKPIPIKSRHTYYNPDRPGLETSVTEIIVRKVDFGESFPKSTFWREGDTKTTVFDAVKGKITPPSVQPTEAKTVVNNLVRVAPETDYSSYLATGGLTLGAAALIAGLVLWFRRP